MASKELIEKFNSYERYIRERGLQTVALNAMVQAVGVALETEQDREYGLMISRHTRKRIGEYVYHQTNGGSLWDLEKHSFAKQERYEVLDLWYEVLKIESAYKFESFMLYMERKRQPEKRFYMPRRKTLSVPAQDLQDLEDRKFKFYGLSMPSRVGKSTLCIFFLAWICYMRPGSHSAMGGHSGVLARGFYKELLNLMSTDEYTFKELFEYLHPGETVIQNKSADEYTINLGKPDRFSTITCRGIDGTWTGAIDVSSDGYLYVDDLVRDRQHSLSPTRMEDTYQEYLNKMVDRKNDGARELMVGTLWNVLDPLERERLLHEGDPDYRFRRIPALDENDESNFDYEYNGFSTAYYQEMRDRIDDAEWCAKFMQRPYVREGILFQQDELRFFNGILPDGDYKIVAVVDVAWGGGDSLSMPIGAEYDNGDVYIFDWVFSRAAKEITLPVVSGKIVDNGIRQVQFEGNTGGDMYASYVGDYLAKAGWKCSCTSKKAPNTMDKNAKIIAYSGDIKRNFVFLDTNTMIKAQSAMDAELGVKRYMRSQEYQNAMDELTSFVTIGKNPHDDAADALTQLAMFLEDGKGYVTKIIHSPI